MIPQGVYNLRNQETHLYLNSGGGSSNGANVQVNNNPWSNSSRWIIRPVAGGLYTLENVNSGKFLNVAGGQNGLWANVWLWDNPDSADSQWEIRRLGEGIYTLKAACCDTFLNVLGGTGANVHMWDNWYSPHSQWAILGV